MTFANDGFVSHPHYLFLPTSPPSSSSQRGMHPALGPPHPWSPDLWSPYYTPNRCTAVVSTKPHDPSTFDPTCAWAPPPANQVPSSENLKHIYPSPPPTDSDPKHTVPLPALSEDSPSYAAGTSSSSSSSTCLHPSPLTLHCCTRTTPTPTPTATTPLTQEDPEGSFTSHPSIQDLLLPPSPPPSLPMVPQALPEATTPYAHDDADVETDDAAEGKPQSQSSSSSPDEPPPSELLTPLTPIWDLPLDDGDARSAGTLEVSNTLLSRSQASPLPQEDRMTLPRSSGASIPGLGHTVESQCGLLRPLVVPQAGFASARFSMVHSFSPSPNFDGLPSDGSIGHSHATSGGKLFVDPPLNLFLSDPGSHHALPQLTLFVSPLRFRRQISLPAPISQELATDTRDAVVSLSHRMGTPVPFGATNDMSQPISFRHPGTEPSVFTSNLFQGAHGLTLDSAPLPMLSEFPSSSVTSDPEPMEVDDDADPSDSPSPDSDDLEQDIVPASPLRRTLTDLHGDDEDFGGSSVPLSPSRRSFADLPEDVAMNEPTTSPPESPLLAGQPLLTLPGAEPDNSLITADAPVSDWSAASPPRGTGLGLFLPIQAASSNQSGASESHAIEPNLNFSPQAVARVDSGEFEKLKSVRRRTWVSERKAKEDEVFHAKRAEFLAGRLSVAPPVPSKLADFDERGGVSAGADADETEGPPPGEPAQMDESDEKTIRTWLLYTEARRAEARRVRKREKERGRELQALLRLRLGEDPDQSAASAAAECAGGAGGTGGSAKVKPGKQKTAVAIVSMPQLVARMIMKRRDTPRPFSPRKHDAPYDPSPLSRFEPTCFHNDGDNMLGPRPGRGPGPGGVLMVGRRTDSFINS